jgi:two-component system cell cycle sensor histidine kinase/response regulator CckA
VGGGTTFKIYLPRTIKPEAQRSSCTAAVSPVRGSETILVVEDDSVVRDLAVQILKAHGYEVLAAEGGPQAVELCQEYGRGIDLLLSDMVMPQMYGRELAEQLRAQRPQMRVLYMSGHSDDVIAYHGVLDEADVFLAKPFTLETLTQKVRHALDVPP